MVRFLSLSFLALVGAMGLVGCGSGGEETVVDPNDWRSQVKTIRIGVRGSEEDPIVLRRWEALEEMLVDVTGLPVKVYEASDYNGIIQALASGQIEFASMGAGSFANLYSQVGEIAVPIVTKRDTHGMRGYYSSIVVHADSGIESIEDLKGRSLAFIDFNSTSGYIYPRAAMREQGINPDTYFGELAIAGGHAQGMMALANGQFDAVVLGANGGSPEYGFYAGALRRMAKRELIELDDYREIWFAGPISNSPYVVRSDMPQALQDLIAGAMTALAYDEPEIFIDIGRVPGTYYSAVDLEFYREIIDMQQREIRQHREQFVKR